MIFIEEGKILINESLNISKHYPTRKYEKISVKPEKLFKHKSEKTKHVLSSLHEVTIELENFNDGDDFIETLTRTRFEELDTDLFCETLYPIEDVLKDANLAKEEIEDTTTSP
jgi:molecular chaperone DnaK (HSP70)